MWFIRGESAHKIDLDKLDGCYLRKQQPYKKEPIWEYILTLTYGNNSQTFTFESEEEATFCFKKILAFIEKSDHMHLKKD